MFDVTMGSYDGAELCELVGLYLLNQLSTVIDKSSVGLYRDDGLAAINNANVPKLDRIHQCLTTIAILKTLEEIERGKLYGSTHHTAKM